MQRFSFSCSSSKLARRNFTSMSSIFTNRLNTSSVSFLSSSCSNFVTNQRFCSSSSSSSNQSNNNRSFPNLTAKNLEEIEAEELSNNNKSKSTTKTSSSSSPSLSRDEILTKRWRCKLGQDKTGGVDMTGKSTTIGVGILGMISSAISNIIRNVTRREEKEEEERFQKQIKRSKTFDAEAEEENEDENNTNSEATADSVEIYGGISWGVYERLDVCVRYVSPADWTVHTRVAENFVGLQCVPPPFSHNKSSNENENEIEIEAESNLNKQPQIHGLSISNFAYLQKVPKSATSADLLKSFLAQFHRSVGRTSIVVGSSTFSPDQVTSEEIKTSVETCNSLVQRCPETDTSIAEILFRPPGTEGRITARAMCKTFFHRSRRRHTVVVYAVPDDEWIAVKEMVQFAIVSVTELAGGDHRQQHDN